MSARAQPREIVIAAYEGMQSLDLTGPLEVFAAAQELIERGGRPDPGYRTSVASPGGHAVRTSSGLQIVPACSLAQAPRPDTLIVPGGSGRADARAAGLVDWIAEVAPRARRVASVCTGAFLLAEAGLLQGRRATTHWASAEQLAREFPEVRVEPDPIHVRDGEVWTSAGVTAGIDLALALVEEDLDRGAALLIARHLVMFLRRPGGQSQFSAALAAPEPAREVLREVQRDVVEQPAGEHTIAAMAARAHMSERHFARAFRAETAMTPARYVQRVRVEAARRRLEEGSEPVEAVARACGLGTAETMRRAFLRELGVPPADYRSRFRGANRPTEEAA